MSIQVYTHDVHHLLDANVAATTQDGHLILKSVPDGAEGDQQPAVAIFARGEWVAAIKVGERA